MASAHRPASDRTKPAVVSLLVRSPRTSSLRGINWILETAAEEEAKDRLSGKCGHSGEH